MQGHPARKKGPAEEEGAEEKLTIRELNLTLSYHPGVQRRSKEEEWREEQEFGDHEHLKFQAVREDVESAQALSVTASTQCDYLRIEVAESQARVLVQVAREQVAPLRAEMLAAFAQRDEDIALLRASVDAGKYTAPAEMVL